jgi:hypothetical protein
VLVLRASMRRAILARLRRRTMWGSWEIWKCPCCRRGEVLVGDCAFGATGDGNGMHRVPCQGCLREVSATRQVIKLKE